MRIYRDPYEAMREVERELWEMGIEVPSNTMQDKVVKDDKDYYTKEIRGYSFMISGWRWDEQTVWRILEYFFPEDWSKVLAYIEQEFNDRLDTAANPGKSYLHRLDLWQEFLHDGKFAYTYSERIAPQLDTITDELVNNPETRQGIINLHSNICPEISGQLKHEHNGHTVNRVNVSADLENRGGGGRVPCSLYYQLMIREGALDWIYAMRSCDFLVHFPVDILLALKLQDWAAAHLGVKVGRFTYFVGSLHAYYKDLEKRGIF
jgi:thymidylate synthase